MDPDSDVSKLIVDGGLSRKSFSPSTLYVNTFIIIVLVKDAPVRHIIFWIVIVTPALQNSEEAKQREQTEILRFHK